jgi:hypothetical protein
VKKTNVLVRLFALRQLSERRAQQVTAFKAAAHRQASTDAARARTASSRHSMEAQEQERSLFSTLARRKVTAGDMEGLRLALDVMALEGTGLRQAEAAANEHAGETATDLAKARLALRARQRKVASLEYLVRKQAAKARRHREAINEVEDSDCSSGTRDVNAVPPTGTSPFQK